MIPLMIVGGSPGSTAGGIKTTTAAVLLLAVISTLRGRSVVFALHVTQTIPTTDLVFEVISALSTVGLSVGATASLDGVGKVIIMFCMFAGRVGPLTLMVVLGDRFQQELWRYPEESVMVG